MVEKDDGLGLNLGLSLGIYQPRPSPRLNMTQMYSSSSSQIMQQLDDHQRYNRDREVMPPALEAAAEYSDEDVGGSSPKSTISSVSGKRSELEANEQENDDEGGGSDDGGRKKLRLTKEQSSFLEETFKEHSTLNPKQKLALSKQLGLRPRQVEVWFQNRRARTKLKQTEVDCEYLKRCCENLTTENKRLQKEAQELRALKLSPEFNSHMNPPTTLTMCPSCQKVATSSSGGSGGGSPMFRTTNPTGTLIQRPVPIKAWPLKQMQVPNS